MPIGAVRFGLIGSNGATTSLVDDDNTEFLLIADQGKIDVSGNYALSEVGSVLVENIGISKKGLNSTQSFSFNSSNNYFKFGTSINPIYGIGDFTIESWVYFDSSYSGLSQRYVFTTKAGGPQPGLELAIFGVELSAGVAPNSYQKTIIFPQNEWVFLAFSRKSGAGYLYVNSTLSDTGINSGNNTGGGTEQPSIGNRTADPSFYLGGKIAELRISNVARYDNVNSPVL
ncbi:MAG: LamG domain-containing protein [Alphaproteobacteria bacterium]|nr:LamG domain-containing protein [Alphaproteobacteria bacterium]